MRDHPPTLDPVQAPGHTPHPTRNAPRCVDCRYLVIDSRQERHYCDHPSMPVDAVTGKPVFFAENARSEDPEPFLVHGLKICSADGLLFSPAVRLRCEECGGTGRVRFAFGHDFADCAACAGGAA